MGELKKSFKSSYNNNDSLLRALLQLLSKNCHKNGGYIVHIGITLLFVGFVGRAFEVEKEFVSMASMNCWIYEEDIGKMCSFLISSDGERISGQAIPVDGNATRID